MPINFQLLTHNYSMCQRTQNNDQYEIKWKFIEVLAQKVIWSRKVSFEFECEFALICNKKQIFNKKDFVSKMLKVQRTAITLKLGT